jgi:hypothetical protein
MDLQQATCSQSADAPYVSVARDERGGAAWVVVNGDARITTSSGAKAMAICEAMRRAKGLPHPKT